MIHDSPLSVYQPNEILRSGLISGLLDQESLIRNQEMETPQGIVINLNVNMFASYVYVSSIKLTPV